MKIKKLAMILSVTVSALLCCNFAEYSFNDKEKDKHLTVSDFDITSLLSGDVSCSSKEKSHYSLERQVINNENSSEAEESSSLADESEISSFESFSEEVINDSKNEPAASSECKEKEDSSDTEHAQESRYTVITDIIELDTYIYNQLGGSIYSYSGCGPTSAAMLLSSEKGMDISKDEIVVNAYDNGFYYDAGINFTSGMGVTLENIQDLVSCYGQDSEIDHLWNNSSEEIIYTINEKLNEGHRLICGHRTFSGTLHYFVIYGKYCEKNCMYYKIVDPWGGTVYIWDQWTLTDRIMSVGGDDETTFEGCVKGLLWLK